jgi:putative tricarboxylic transport membrane protein
MRYALALLSVLVLMVVATTGMAAPAYPSKALEFIAPAGAGGGWDLTARQTAKALADEKLVTVPISVINMPGGSGAVAISHMITRRKGDPHTLTVMGSSLTGTLARSVVPYTYKDVTPIAAVTGDFQAVVVRKDSTFNNLKTFMEVLKRDPGMITIGGGSAPGSLDHLSFALLAKSQGIDITKVRYVPFGDGATAMTNLLGGSVTALSGSLSDMLAGYETGNVRFLGITAPSRLTGSLKDVLTAKEQGINVTFVNWRGFYMAPDVAPDVVKFWEDAFAKLLRSGTWTTIRAQMKWEPFVLFGGQLKKFLESDISETQTLLREAGIMR